MRYGGGSQEYRTPEVLLAPVYALDDVALDPCGHPQSVVKASRHILLPEHAEPEDGRVVTRGDGLKLPWSVGGLNFVNPPFGDVDSWLTKALSERDSGASTVMLLNASTDTTWFQDVVWPNADAFCFFRGRKAYLGAKHSNPHPHLYVFFGARDDLFRAVFDMYGRVV